MLKRKVAIAALTVALLTGSGTASAQSSSYFDECAYVAFYYALACAVSPAGLQQSGKISQANLAAAYFLTLMLYNRFFGGNTNVSSLDVPGQTGVAAQAGGGRWNAWAGGAYNEVANKFAPASSSGDIKAFVAGADYTLSNNMVVGLAVSFDTTNMRTGSTAGTFESSGYSIAPYIAIPLTRNFLFDASIGYGYADLESLTTIPLTVRTAALDQRWYGAASLSYAAPIGKWLLTGKGSYLYARDDVGPFASAAVGTISVGNTTELGQVRIGGQAAYDTGTGFHPYVGLTYINDVQRENQAPVGGFVAANDRDAWNVAVGFNYYSKGAVSGGIQLSSDVDRRETRNNQIMGNIAIRF